MASSILDEMMAREGHYDPDLLGVNATHAGDLDWCREKGECERDFLSRVVREARAAGYRIVQIGGALMVDDIVSLRRPDHFREVGGNDAA
jgi:hypothetical protein